jgi:hypothetical protein
MKSDLVAQARKCAETQAMKGNAALSTLATELADEIERLQKKERLYNVAIEANTYLQEEIEWLKYRAKRDERIARLTEIDHKHNAELGEVELDRDALLLKLSEAREALERIDNETNVNAKTFPRNIARAALAAIGGE